MLSFKHPSCPPVTILTTPRSQLHDYLSLEFFAASFRYVICFELHSIDKSGVTCLDQIPYSTVAILNKLTVKI